MRRVTIESWEGHLYAQLESATAAGWVAEDVEPIPFESITRRMIAMGSLPSRVVPDADHFHPARFLRVVRGMWN